MCFTILVSMTPIIIHIADSTVMVKIHYIFRDINTCSFVCAVYITNFMPLFSLWPRCLNVKCICKHNIYIPKLTVWFYLYVNSIQLSYFGQCNKFCVYAYNLLLSLNIISIYVIIDLNIHYTARSQSEC